MPQPLDWPDPSLNRNDLTRQVMTAHWMIGASRGRARSPAVKKCEWDLYEALSAGVPVADRRKFDIWLEGTARFLRSLPGDKDCGEWLADAYRIARRLDPVNAPPPDLTGPLDRNQALVELEVFRKWCALPADGNRGEAEDSQDRGDGESGAPAGDAPATHPATDENNDNPPRPAVEGQTPAQPIYGASQGRREPSKDAVAAYRLQLLTGKTQAKLAEQLTEELGRPVDQGTVSRWLSQVKEWLEAGNVLPDLTAVPNRKPTPMDPEKIDLGERQDGRAKRQTERHTSVNDD